MDNTDRYANRQIEVSLRREGRNSNQAAPILKIHAKYQPGLMTVEIDQIKAGH